MYDIDNLVNGKYFLIFISGSIQLSFTVIFLTKELPKQTSIRAILTTAKVTTDTGSITVSLGIFILEETTIVVAAVTVIQAEDNPVPSNTVKPV